MTPRAPGPIVARQGSGTPILLLHALGADRRMWDGLPALLPDRTVLTYEFPGHGQAPVPEQPYTVHDLGEQVAEALAADGWNRVHVLGVSLGGLVAQDLAAHHPQLVARLVLVDTVATYPPEFVRRWHERAALARASGIEPLVGPTLETWFTAGLRAADPPQVRLVRAMLAATDPHGYALACEALADADTRELVGRISAPTLVVCGDDDMPPFVEATRWLTTRLADAEAYWLSPARHMGLLELPERFATKVLAFLDAA